MSLGQKNWKYLFDSVIGLGYNIFLPARRIAQRGLCDGNVSVYLSVRRLSHAGIIVAKGLNLS